jgi:hypothetical protein
MNMRTHAEKRTGKRGGSGSQLIAVWLFITLIINSRRRSASMRLTPIRVK